MKRTVNVAIGGCSFTIDDDAYETLNEYLERFNASLDGSSSSKEVMDELECRIADLLKEKLCNRQVVDITMAESVIGQLGYPVDTAADDKRNKDNKAESQAHETTGQRKLYRDPDDKRIAGVCSGLSIFFDIDVVLVRVIFLVGLFFGSAGFWVYLAIWIAAPVAKTAAEKCEMRGIPPTAENIRKYTEGQ